MIDYVYDILTSSLAWALSFGSSVNGGELPRSTLGDVALVVLAYLAVLYLLGPILMRYRGMRPFIKPDLGLHRFILVQVTTVEYAFVLLEAGRLFRRYRHSQDLLASENFELLFYFNYLRKLLELADAPVYVLSGESPTHFHVLYYSLTYAFFALAGTRKTLLTLLLAALDMMPIQPLLYCWGILGTGRRAPDSEELVLERIIVHPIKSCRGSEVQSSGYSSTGLDFDRSWLVVDAETHKFITARTDPILVLINPTIDLSRNVLVVAFLEPGTNAPDPSRPSFEIPLRPPQTELSKWEVIDDVQIWASTVSAYVVKESTSTSSDPGASLSAFIGRPVLLVYRPPNDPQLLPRKLILPSEKSPEAYPLPSSLPDDTQVSFADGFPFLVVSSSSATDLERQILEGGRVASGKARPGDEEILSKWEAGEGDIIRRTRGNLVIGCGGGQAGKGKGMPWDEDNWGVLEIGEEKGEFVMISKCIRCLLPNVDPSTAISHHSLPYKILSKTRRVDPVSSHGACFGINAVPKVSKGQLKVGDVVRIVKRNAWGKKEESR